MLMPCTANLAVSADEVEQAENTYTFNFDTDVEFNRVQLIWDNAQSDEVTVTANEQTLQGKANGKILNLNNSEISSSAEQTFSRSSITSSDITVQANSKPAVRLYKDSKLTVDENSITKTNLTGEKYIFDGSTGSQCQPAVFAAIENGTEPSGSSFTASLDDTYDISEAVLYTHGLSGWYPRSYQISMGDYTVQGTSGKQFNLETDTITAAKFPQFNPYILSTTINTTANAFTVTFPNGGYSDADDTTGTKNQYGFRIREFELYGSKAPVWASDKYQFDLKEEKSFNRIQLAWNEPITSDIIVETEKDGVVTNTYQRNVSNDTSINIFDSVISTTGTSQSIARTQFDADKINVYASSEPAIRLYNDENIKDHITNTSATNLGASVPTVLFNGTTYSDDSSERLESTRNTTAAPVSSVSGTLDKSYNLSECVIYTWGPNGWYPISYKINADTKETDGTAIPAPNYTETSVAKIYPQYKPYILNTPLNAFASDFTITFPEGGYNDSESGKTTSHSFRLYEIELYGSTLPIYMSDDFKTYSFTADDISKSNKIKVISDSNAVFVKLNDTLTYLPLTNGIGTIDVPDEFTSISVQKTGASFPKVQLTRNTASGTIADTGNITVPTTYSDATENGKAYFTDSRKYENIFDATFKDTADGNGTVYPFVGKQIALYWNKYKNPTVDIPEDDTNNYADCSAWFTVDLGKSKTINNIELLEYYGDNYKAYITDDIKNYGTPIQMTSTTSTKYTIDRGDKYVSQALNSWSCTPNVKGRYIKIEFTGKATNSSLTQLSEMIVSVPDEIVASSDPSDIKYSVSVTKSGVPDNTDISVTYNDTEITDTVDVANGTVLSINAPTVAGYNITVKANNETLSSNDGTYTYTVTADTEISITYTKNSYKITKSDSIGGTFKVSAESASVGDIITISDITANSGYEFDSIKVTKSDDITQEVKVDNNSFTMPLYPVTVTVTFKKIDYSISTNATNGTISPNKSSANAGETITFTISANSGYSLVKDSVKVNDGSVEVSENNGTYSFTMPAEAVTISAVFSENAQSITGTVTGGTFKIYAVDDNNRATFTQTVPTGGKFIVVPTPENENSTLTSPISVTGAEETTLTTVTGDISGEYMVYIMGTNGAVVSGAYTVNTKTYTITKTTSEHGDFSVSSTTAEEGTTITISDITPNVGYELDSVYAYATGSEKTDNDKLTDNNGFQFVLTDNTTVEVTFKKLKYTITWKNYDGNVLTTSSVEYSTVPSYPTDAEKPSKPSDENYDYSFKGWMPALKSADGNAEYTAEFTAIAKEAPKTYLTLLDEFSNKIQIEKKISSDNDAVLTVTKAENYDGEIPELKAYIAVYDNGIITSLYPHSFMQNEVTLSAEEVSGNYKVFIWTNNYIPVIEPITALTENANKLFN